MEPVRGYPDRPDPVPFHRHRFHESGRRITGDPFRQTNRDPIPPLLQNLQFLPPMHRGQHLCRNRRAGPKIDPLSGDQPLNQRFLSECAAG